MNIKPVLKTVANFMKRNAGKILAGMAVATEFLGFWFMHKEAPIVRDRLEALGEGATWKDKLKAAGPVYLPAAGMLLLSSGCIIGGCVAGERKAAILSGLYSASEAALRQYEEKVVDALGKDKAREIHDSIAQDVINERPVSAEVVYATGKGDQLFYEPLTGRYFTSSINEVAAAATRINRRIIVEMWASANEWFNELGLESVGFGDIAGWNVDHMLEVPDGKDHKFTTSQTDDGRSCFVVTYFVRPVLYK